LWGLVWYWLLLIRILLNNLSFVPLAVKWLKRKYLAASESNWHFDSCRGREPHRYSLNLPYFRLYVSRYGSTHWELWLLFWVSKSIYRLYWRREYLSCELLLSTCCCILPHGWVQKSLRIPRKISFNIASNKSELYKLTLVWPSIGQSIWLIPWEFEGTSQSLCNSMYLTRKSIFA